MAMFTVDYAQMSRERALNDRINDLEDGLSTAQSQLTSVATLPFVVPTIGNRVRNGEMDFNDLVYIPATYGAASADRPFGWYAQDSTVNTVITETVAALESAKSIKLLKTGKDAIISLGTPNQLDSASGQFVAGDVGNKIFIKGAGAAGANLLTTVASFVSATQITITAAASTAVSGVFFATYPNVSTAWHKGQGNLWIGGIDAIYAPIPKTLFYPGKPVFLVGKVKLNGDMDITPLDPTWRLRLALYDNTAGQQKIIEGSPFKVTGSVISGAGAATRHYIVKVITNTIVFYLSDITTPLSIGSLPAVVPAGSAGAVGLSWDSYTDAQAYEVYRSDDGTSLADYYKLIRITNGDTTFIDQGGRPGSPFAFTVQVNPRAEIFIEAFGLNVSDLQWLQFGGVQGKPIMLTVPGNYNYGATTGKQLFRMDVVDVNDSPVALDPLSLIFDQAGVGLTNGGFDYSAEDLQFTGNVVITNPDPSTGGSGGGGGSGPDDPTKGGGGFLPY